jgi:hypothetical protein
MRDDPLSRYSYRVRPELDVWRWELYRGEVLFASGLEPTCVRARAKALIAAVAANEVPAPEAGAGGSVLDDA